MRYLDGHIVEASTFRGRSQRVIALNSLALMMGVAAIERNCGVLLWKLITC